jgi:hypothetical protein
MPQRRTNATQSPLFPRQKDRSKKELFAVTLSTHIRSHVSAANYLKRRRMLSGIAELESWSNNHLSGSIP